MRYPVMRTDGGGLNTLQNQVNRLFDDFFQDFGLTSSTEPTVWAPALDIQETPENLVVKMDIPGVDPRKVDISITGDLLQIRGERSEKKEEHEGTWHRVERRHGAFARSFTLPFTVNADKISAESEDGVLTLRIPKAAESRPHKIEIRTKSKK